MAGSSSQRDYYEVLGVVRSANADELKSAFRKAAAQHHPDRNPGDPQAAERFKEVNQAYQVLGDEQRRAVYDRFGHRAEDPGSPFAGSGPFAGGVIDFSDLAGAGGIFGDLFGMFTGQRGDKGDMQRELEIEFTEAAFGCEKELSYERIDTCTTCTGVGGAPGSAVDVCKGCAGRGRVRIQQALIPVAVERPCPDCRGRGRVVRVPCGDCSGSGLMKRQKTLSVKLEAGIEPGSATLVRGAGNRPRPDRAPGDLELTIKVKSHPFFRRVGTDVLCTVPITFPQAALGSEIEVPTLEGRGKLRVPAGTQPGAVLRIRGKGIPHARGRGDQRVEVTLEVPSNLTERQRELINELASEFGDAVQPERRGFMDKLKELFG